MTEQQIIEKLEYWVNDRQYPFQLFRSFVYEWESDYWVMDSDGITREYEIKISRHDFKKDSLKTKHQVMHEQGPNYFYYVCPKDMIKPDEIDKRYGLVYIWDTGHISVAKRPVKLHGKKFENWKHLAIKLYWKWRKIRRQQFIDGKITRQEFKQDKINAIS